MLQIKQTLKAAILSIGTAILLITPAKASDIVVTPNFDASNQAAPPDTTDYEGVFYDESTTFPPSSITIGNFNFTIPTGDSVVGATISGTFGDVNEGVTALTDLFVLNGSIKVGECDLEADGVTFPPCAAGTIDGSLVPWSYTFNSADLSALASDFSSGSIDFTAVQNSAGAVVVGSPVLDIQITPEPSTIFTLGAGLFGVAAFRRRK